MVKCPGCGSENPARSSRCRRCRLLLPATASSQRGASLPVWMVGALVAIVASVSFWLGLETGRQGAHPEGARAAAEVSAPTPHPDPVAITTPPMLQASDPVATAVGPTWAIYTSRDRLSDGPIFGARFGTASGTPLFSVLCVEEEAALALKRGLLPAVEGAGGNKTAALETIRVGVRIGARERDRVTLRFEEGPPESFDAVPKKPGDFLRRVATARRIRTATDDFDPVAWSEALARVTSECRFDERPASAPSRAKARR